MVGINVMFCMKHKLNDVNTLYYDIFTSPPFVSSHRPNTEFAAAKTEHREFNVVVIPAFRHDQTLTYWITIQTIP